MSEQISTADLERHKLMHKRLGEAKEIQGQIEQLIARQRELVGAFKIWSEELHERYGLALDGSEGVLEDGTLQRK